MECFTPGDIFEDIADNELDYETINPRQAVNDDRIINHFHNLSYARQDKVIEQVKLLIKIPEYQKKENEQLKSAQNHILTMIYFPKESEGRYLATYSIEKGLMLMYVAWSDLITFVMIRIAIITLVRTEPL